MTATRLLDERFALLRNRTRAALEDLRVELATFGATREDLDTLRQAAHDLDELFLLVIVGEFNAGKSALINALVGATILEEGVTPTTTAINVLRHGQNGSERWLNEQVLEKEFDAPILQDVAVVDTPGTNAIHRQHQQLTEQFVPRSDLVLFVTSAERPFTESERAFLQSIRAWGKKVVLVINKVDLLDGPDQLRQVVAFVQDNVQALLGFSPTIFPVSARQARLTSTDGANGFSTDPAFSRLQSFIHETLSTENRVKLKLSSPLGVAERLAEKYQAAALSRLDLLADDARAGESIESQLDSYHRDMESGFASRLDQVENVIYDLMRRADRFFDETFRLARIFDLVNADKVRAEFDREVVGNTADKIDEAVDSIATWMVDRELQIWKVVTDELSKRRQAGPHEMVLGDIGGFETNRRELLHNVSRSARQVIGGFDRDAEARLLGTTMRDAVAQTALVEAGALGLGTVITLVVGTAAADISGILAGTVVAGLGLYIIPARKQQVQKQFRQRADELRHGLRESMARQLQSESNSSVERLRSAVSPYVGFVRSEQKKVDAFHERLGGLRQSIGTLRREIGSPPLDG